MANGSASFIVCFSSHKLISFFLSADFIMILKDQSMFSGNVDEIPLTTSLFDNLLLLSWNLAIIN